MGPANRDWKTERARDTALVAACLRGDEEAWTAVWHRYAPLVKAVARRTGCDAEEARDAGGACGLFHIHLSLPSVTAPVRACARRPMR